MQRRPDAHPFVRWADDASNDDVSRDLGNLFRSVRPAEPMSPAELESTRRKLAVAARRPRMRAFSPVALALSLLAGGASAGLAEWVHPGWWRLRSEVLAPPIARDRVVLPERTTHEPAPATSDEAAPVEPIDPAPVTAPLRAERAAPSAPPAATKSALALESESLQRALVALRREHDAAAALVLLDEHEIRFPRGELALEAAAARVDALLLLGRRADALARLDRMPLDGAGPRGDLLLLRAEIRADDDCPRALADFDKVLGRQTTPAIGERALFGRAACRVRAGDGPGADADLRSYLARFPNGRFADQVRARLAPR
jgi:hypothetical protein